MPDEKIKDNMYLYPKYFQEETESHWNYIRGVISKTIDITNKTNIIVMTKEEFLDYIGKFYKDALLHGFNHGKEDK